MVAEKTAPLHGGDYKVRPQSERQVNKHTVKVLLELDGCHLVPALG
jgi:hypothetical protein